jgi:hypothetical protein
MDASQRVCSVEVLCAPGGDDTASHEAATDTVAGPAQPSLSRPARVANDRYRKNWDAIFEPKRKPTLN